MKEPRTALQLKLYTFNSINGSLNMFKYKPHISACNSSKIGHWKWKFHYYYYFKKMYKNNYKPATIKYVKQHKCI